MKKYLLDTNICIFFMKGKYGIDKRIEKVKQKNCFISEITAAELLYGSYHSNNPDKYVADTKKFLSFFTILPIFSSLETFAIQKSKLIGKGAIIDNFDLLIGATAIHNGMIMVTENVRHLSRLEGIVVENWVER